MIKDEYFTARQHMVEEQIAARGIVDKRLLAAMRSVPRHRFVPIGDLAWAYADSPLPIGYGQTISQPYIVALMTEYLLLKGKEIVLEIGTGSGYQAAVLGCLCKEVHTLEIIPDLAALASDLLLELGYLNVHVHCGDGSQGWSSHAPYGGILVAAAAPAAPQPLLDQLVEGGQLVVPVGGRGYQRLEIWTHHGDAFDCQTSSPVAFVPLRGEYGWK
jgi:protein-L-isoaspartate(D-aspartate) O-methyltransferase